MFVHHVATVVLHGVGAGALVEHGVEPTQLAAREAVEELVLVEVVGDAARREVGNLSPSVEVVDGDDVVDAERVEPVHEVGADEAGGAGHDDFMAFPHPNSSSRSTRGGAELADDDAGGAIGDAHRLVQARRPRPSIRASVAITVSPAPVTSKTSRACVGTCSMPVVVEQRHALFAARDQQGVEVDAPAQRLRALVQRRPRRASAPTPARSSERFGVITVAPAIARVVAALRVDQHRLAGRRAELDHARHVGQPALAVVGEQHHVVRRQRRSKSSSLRPAPRGRARLEVDAEQLLRAADHAQLDGGRRSGSLVQRCASTPAAHSNRRSLPAGLVVANHGRAASTALPASRRCSATLAAPAETLLVASPVRPAPGLRARCGPPCRTSNGPASRRRRRARGTQPTALWSDSRFDLPFLRRLPGRLDWS